MSEKAYKPKKGENFPCGLRRLEFPGEVDAVPGKGLRGRSQEDTQVRD